MNGAFNGWDETNQVAHALALSRLVRDNAHCSEFAGRISTNAEGAKDVAPVSGFEFRLAYQYGRDRDWLDTAEAGELAALLDAFWQVEPHWSPRVRRAINFCERASQTMFLLESQPRLVTGLEALLTTSNHQAKRQFRQRVYRLAAELEIDGVSRRLLDRMYEARSQAYHGDEVELYSGHPGSDAPEQTPAQRQAITEARLLQQVLRGAVRRAIEDAEFRAVFADDQRIRERWPVSVGRRFHLGRRAL